MSDTNNAHLEDDANKKRLYPDKSDYNRFIEKVTEQFNYGGSNRDHINPRAFENIRRCADPANSEGKELDEWHQIEKVYLKKLFEVIPTPLHEVLATTPALKLLMPNTLRIEDDQKHFVLYSPGSALCNDVITELRKWSQVLADYDISVIVPVIILKDKRRIIDRYDCCLIWIENDEWMLQIK